MSESDQTPGSDDTQPIPPPPPPGTPPPSPTPPPAGATPSPPEPSLPAPAPPAPSPTEPVPRVTMPPGATPLGEPPVAGPPPGPPPGTPPPGQVPPGRVPPPVGPPPGPPPGTTPYAGPAQPPSGPPPTAPAGGSTGGKGGRTALIAILVVLAIVAVGVGAFLVVSGGDDDDTASSTSTTAGERGPTAISSVDDAESGVVEIVIQGSFVDPEFGELLDSVGGGSGFFIDPSGILVTNNHVVTGAATLEVFVPGEDEGRNARVIGRSECSDLAVVKVEADDDEVFPYFEWYDGDLEDLEDDEERVYALGYPAAEDNEYTETRGEVTDADADGETAYSSIDGVVEHDADISPGNSGGPLITEDGQVVGVNYFSWGDDEYLAISSDLAQRLIRDLAEGTDVDSLGVNSQAVYDDATGESGIWVAGVETGSVADEVGLLPGDVITRMEGISVGYDGTLRDYCDVMRSRDPGDPIAIQVLRYDTGEILQGVFNGDELEFVDFLSDEFSDDVDLGDGSSYAAYVFVEDDSGVISVEVPDSWSDLDGTPFILDDGTEAPSIAASPDLLGFGETYDVPGVIVAGIAGDFDYSAELAAMMESSGAVANCSDTDGEQPYEDVLYTGVWEVRYGCGSSGAALAGIVAGPPDKSFTVLVLVQMVSDADFEALDRILSSFVVSL